VYVSSNENPEDPPARSSGEILYESIALDRIPDAIVIADAETRRIVRVNEAATELFRCQRRDLVGCLQTELHPAGEAEKYVEAFQRGLENQRVNRLASGAPLFIKTADGDSVPVEINVSLIEQDGSEYLMGTFREASEQLARERALERATGRLEALVKSIPVPVAVIDTDGIVKRWNRAAEKTLGYTAEEVIGERDSLFINPDEYASLLERVTSGEAIHEYNSTLRAKDGSRIPAVINARPIYEDGTVTGVVGTAADTSDRQQREQQLELLHRMARHNLRNELTVIRAWGEMVADTDSDNEEASTMIVNASDRLLELSDEVRSIPRAVSENQQDMQTRAISRLVTGLSEQLRANESVAETEVTADSTAGQIQARAAEAVSELFSNLFNCGERATAHLRIATADSYTNLFVTSDTPLFCTGERVLIEQGTETPLQHASGLEIAQSYLTVKSVGGAITLESGTADAPATDLQVEIPRADTQ
jgi:PAS domain S-box-containing protein